MVINPIDVIIVPIDPPVDPPVETDLSGCTSTSGCSSAELAQKDLLDWTNALVAAIPSGVGTITLTGDIYTVSISWDDNRNPDDGSETNVQVSFQL
jgi:type IV pilus assembly protein PilV